MRLSKAGMKKKKSKRSWGKILQKAIEWEIHTVKQTSNSCSLSCWVYKTYFNLICIFFKTEDKYTYHPQPNNYSMLSRGQLLASSRKEWTLCAEVGSPRLQLWLAEQPALAALSRWDTDRCCTASCFLVNPRKKDSKPNTYTNVNSQIQGSREWRGVLEHFVCHYWTNSLPTDPALTSHQTRQWTRQFNEGIHTLYFDYSWLDICLYSKNVPGHDT